MKRTFKVFAVLIVIGLIGLIGFAYLGNLAPEPRLVEEAVSLDAN